MEKILIIDFGSQVTQLIAKTIRSLEVYCEIIPFNKVKNIDSSIKGIILSGSHYSVRDDDAPYFDFTLIPANVPILGICFGAQLLADYYGGKVIKSNKREYGRAKLLIHNKDTDFFSHITKDIHVWMSHSDTIHHLRDDFEILARSSNIPIAAFCSLKKKIYGVQFHPEVTHTEQGKTIIENFIIKICQCHKDWTSYSYIEHTIKDIQKIVGENKKVIMALSGGVDSTVAAVLIQKAIGNNLIGVFVNNGLLRKNEYEQVIHTYKDLGLNVKAVDASDRFLDALHNVTDPEQKRKIIGKNFIDVFEQESKILSDVDFLGQGTIYPDVIESVSVHSKSATIKSHHNVGGLPERMQLKIIEPLRLLFKDEVRNLGKSLNIPDTILQRHPFPGPGLGIRILGAVTKEKVRIVQEADDIFISEMKKNHLYSKVWQAGVILLPIQSVGVMGDERTYEYVVALRAVESVDGMTADWVHFPYDFLAHVSNRIVNEVKGVNRVTYDITSKPPGTIEWE